MSRSPKQQAPVKPKFDTRPYERPGLSESDILQIKEIFDMFDREHTGSIHPREIKQSLAALGNEAKSEPIYQLLVDLNAEGHGNLTFEDFIHLLTPRFLENDTRENIDKIFALFDYEKTGLISIKDLRRIAHELGEDLSEQDLQEMIARADADKDGMISKEEFFVLLTSGGRGE